MATKKRATLEDRRAKRLDDGKGRGVEALFETAPEEATKSARRRAAPKDTPVTSTFNLYSQHQDFLDDFVRQGKRQFRRNGVGVGAINKSVVLQELLELLKADEELQERIIQTLERQGREESSRHDPRKRRE